MVTPPPPPLLLRQKRVSASVSSRSRSCVILARHSCQLSLAARPCVLPNRCMLLYAHLVSALPVSSTDSCLSLFLSLLPLRPSHLEQAGTKRRLQFQHCGSSDKHTDSSHRVSSISHASEPSLLAALDRCRFSFDIHHSICRFSSSLLHPSSQSGASKCFAGA